MGVEFEHKDIIAITLLKKYMFSIKRIILEVSSDYCMKPFLLNKDQIVVHKVSAKDLTLGDIIIYHGGNCFYVHRFLYKYRSRMSGKLALNSAYMLIAKGDNLIYPDDPFSEDKLIGKAVIIKRKNKQIYLEGFFWSKANYIVGILCLFQLFIYRILRSIKVLFWKDKVIPFAEPLKRIFILPFKPIISALRLFSP